MRMTQIRKSSFFAASLLMVFPFGAATADTINGAGGGWQSWSSANLYQGTSPTPGTPYWNNSSGDGYRGNVGWCVAGGSSVCSMPNSPGAAMPYYGTASGGSVANMYLTSAGAPLTLSVSTIITDEKSLGAGYDVFGYYVVPASGSPTLVPLFSTLSATVGSTAPLDLASGTNYGFYIENIKGGGTGSETDYTWYMNSGLNNVSLVSGGTPLLGPDSLQHFAIFQTSNGYIIGDVDGDGCTGNPTCVPPNQFDYNDFVINLSPATPEPATAGLMAISLLLLGGFVWRKLHHSA